MERTSSTATFTGTDHQHMRRALQLAQQGEFTTRPNPMVGCVIAHGEDVVGEAGIGVPAGRTRRCSRCRRPVSAHAARLLM